MKGGKWGKVCTDHQTGEEQCNFRITNGCASQVFAVKNVNEKYIKKQ